jgi:hypothetical protein
MRSLRQTTFRLMRLLLPIAWVVVFAIVFLLHSGIMRENIASRDNWGPLPTLSRRPN